MSDFDINSFDFSAMTASTGIDPFAKKQQFEHDDRFYKLERDSKTDIGYVTIAFLPDKNNRTLLKMIRINSTVNENGKKHFFNDWSPATIGKPCPFYENARRLYQADEKEGYGILKTQQRFIANIKVLKDPQNPENNGKIFLYDMSKTLTEAIQHAVIPVDPDEKPKELFNPLKGWIVKLTMQKGANGFYNYTPEFKKVDPDNSSVSIYGYTDTREHINESGAKALQDIKDNTYDLSEFYKPENFKSYDELYVEMQKLIGGKYGIPALESSHTDTPKVQINDNSSDVHVEVESTAQKPSETLNETVKQPVDPDTQPKSNLDIDSILAGI